MAEIWLVTGGAGFIGSNFVRLALGEGWADKIIVLDALTYAGSLENLHPLWGEDNRLVFTRGDITNAELVNGLLRAQRPNRIFHFAAESHVDRSIANSHPFIRTNIVGTQVILDQARIEGVERVVHVSTDEVYGALPLDSTERFSETTSYAPNSPYAASKAASDMLARAAFHTYGQDVVITNTCNNYGPFQFPEKFIPVMIMNAMHDRPLPVYGDGLYVRDWIHVIDHCTGVYTAGMKGKAGETYCIGSDNEQPNIAVVRRILELTGKDESLISYVKDRPGHDRRYSIDATKIRTELGWAPQVSWEEGLATTVDWYRQNTRWFEIVAKAGGLEEWYEKNYGARGAAG